MKKMIPRKSAVLSFLSRRLKPIIHIGTHRIRKNNASFLRIFLGIKSPNKNSNQYTRLNKLYKTTTLIGE